MSPLLAPGTPKQFQREMSKHTEAGFRIAGVRGFDGGFLLTVLVRPVIEQEFSPPLEGAEPQYITIDERDRQKLFDAVGDAAARGYRIVETVPQGFDGRGHVVLLDRETVPGRPYSYYFLGAPMEVDLEDRLNEGANEGYRFRTGLERIGGEDRGRRGVRDRRRLRLCGLYGEVVVMRRAVRPRFVTSDSPARPECTRA